MPHNLKTRRPAPTKAPLGTGQYCAVVNHGRGWGEEGTVGYRLLVYLDGVRLLLRAGHIVNISGGKIIRGQWNQVATTWLFQQLGHGVSAIRTYRENMRPRPDSFGKKESKAGL